jgi:dTDP-4-amino-4,6-dideoxygalactose transaminase
MIIPFHAPSRFYEHHLDAYTEIARNILLSGRWIEGDFTRQIEEAIAAGYGMKQGICCSSCTDALYLSLNALDIGQGDEVILPAFTFIATLNAVLRTGATPVFADIDRSFGINPAEVERLITPRSKAIVAVHLFGYEVDMPALAELAKQHSLWLIEDAAQSIHPRGGRYGHSASAAVCISFDPTKVVNAPGTAGMVISNDGLLAQKIRNARSQGKSGGDYPEKGFNSRLSELEAAAILLQWQKLDELIADRQQTAAAYIQRLSGLDGLQLPSPENNLNWHKFVIMTPDRDRLTEMLKQHGIETMVHFPKPLYQYGLYKNHFEKTYRCEVTENCCRTALSLPLHNYMTEEQIGYLCSTIQNFYR